MKNVLSIRLPPPLRKELRRLCKRTRRPASEVVRESLRRYLAVERFQVLRRKVLPFAEAAGFLTDEDVFRALP